MISSMEKDLRESEVEWLGSVPQTWLIDNIGSLYTLRNTKVSDVDYPPLSVTMQGIVPQLDSAAKSDAHDDRKLVCKGDFVINSRSDRRGSCGIAMQDGSVSLINTVLTPRNEMDPGYYNWLFHTVQFADEFYKWGHGIVDDLWTTNWQEMKRISVPMPPLDVQERISKYLDSIIEEINSIISDANESIDEYREWKFALIREAVTKGIKHYDRFKDTDIEWMKSVPEEWNVTKLHNICSFLTGGTPSTSNPEWFGGNLQWFTPGDFNDLYDMYESARTLTQKAKEDNVARIVPADTVLLIGIGGTAGKIGYTRVECSFNQQITAITPKYDSVYSRYLMYSLIPAATYLKETIMHTTLPIINNQTLGGVSIAIPDVSTQKEIVDYLDKKCPSIEALINEKKALIDELEEFKKSVIYETVTGKRKVV